MKKNTQVTRFGSVALLALAGAFVLATAAPAFATEPLVVEGVILEIADLEMPAVEEAAIAAEGDMQIVHQEEITDGGFDEMVEPDEPEDETAPDGGEEVVEPEDELIPDDGGEEADVPDEATETITPERSRTETTPAEPDEPADTPDEPSLPFTGGNSTPYVLGGLLMALAGVGVLIARRQVFNR